MLTLVVTGREHFLVPRSVEACIGELKHHGFLFIPEQQPCTVDLLPDSHFPGDAVVAINHVVRDCYLAAGQVERLIPMGKLS